MMDNIPLYNSVLLKTYMDLLEAHYPDVDIDQLLQHAKIAPHEMEDHGQWFTQEQVDLFYEFLTKTTGNPEIAREAGRFAAQSKSSSLLRQYAMGFISPAVAYWMIGKLAITLSRHFVFEVNHLASNKLMLISTPKEGVNEKLYQCQNRVGLFEGLSKVFTSSFATVEHIECIHQGAPSCKYIISWKITPAMIWKKIGNYLPLLSIISLPILFFLVPFSSWIIYFLIAALISASSLLIAEKLSTKDLNKSITSQQNVTEKLMNQFNIRYNELALIKEIGEAASSILEPEELLNFVCDAVQKRLQFSRGMIMLANPERTSLIYKVGYGYTPHEEAVLKSTHFNLTNKQSKGIFYLAYQEKKPFLVDRAEDIEGNISLKSSKYLKELGVHAFICVPIVYEGKSEGILAVDKSATDGQPTQSDMSLLMGIAQQIGISLNNALAHKKIKESEERFRNLSDNSPDMIYQLDLTGSIKYTNPVWKEILGYRQDELQDKPFADLLRREDRVSFNLTLQNILNNKTTMRDHSFTILNEKLFPRYITFSGTPDCDAEGNVIGVIGTLKDISRLRSMESQLLQASKMEAVGTLTGGIAHDFNNIIQAIMGYNQLMISGRLGNEPDMPYLNSIGELIQRSRELVRQLLLFSKKVEPFSKVVNINEEIKSMHNLLVKSIPKMIEIQTDLDSEVALINADSTQIGQIIMNLVINARDAMGDSGHITIKTNNLNLTENTLKTGMSVPAGNYVEISISDTGCGMDKEVTEHIFEPFFTTKETGKGTGLGLAVVHGIVNNHNGFIFCESEPNKGTTFRILFPASTSEKVQQKPVEKPQYTPYGTERILLVDDEKNILEIGKETLKMFGYDVLIAENGEQALEIYRAQKDKINLVILDLIMPGKGGKKCLIDLKAMNPSVKVLMTSGYSSSEQTEELARVGATDFINKPYRPEDLLLTIRKILDGPNHPDNGFLPLHSNKGV